MEHWYSNNREFWIPVLKWMGLFGCFCKDISKELTGRIYSDQGYANGSVGGGASRPVFSNLQESWSKVSQAARGLATVVSVTIFWYQFSNNSWSIGQNAPPPTTEGVSAHH